MCNQRCSRLSGRCFGTLLAMLVSLSLLGPTLVRAEPNPADPGQGDQKNVRILQDRDGRLIAALPNRMIVAIQETRAAPVVSVRMVVKTGSIYEQEFIGAGLSHYLEHLVCGGTTTTRTEAEGARLLSSIGGQINATTGLDRVNYFIHTTRDHAATAIDLVNDWVANCTIDEAEFLREKQVINSEFAMGRGDPGRVLWRNTQQARFQLHPARHPTIGYLDEFNQITREQLIEFFKRMYVPNNMVMVVVGDVDRKAVLEQIAEFWKDRPARDLPTIRFPVEEVAEHTPTQEARADVRATRLRLAWPGTVTNAEHDYALNLLASVLSSGDASRLVRSIRDEQRLVNTISAGNISFSWGEGFFSVDAELASPRTGTPQADMSLEDRLKEVEGAIMAELNKVIRDGVNEDELARAKRRVRASVAMSGQSAQGLASSLAWNLITSANPDHLQDYVEAINKLTTRDLQIAAEKFIRADRTMRIVLRPLEPGTAAVEMTRPEEPDPSEFKFIDVDLDNRLLIERLQEKLERPREDGRAADSGQIVEHTLDNGLRVLIRPTTLVPAAAAHFYQSGGLLADPQGSEGLAGALAWMKMRGTRELSADQLARRLDELGARISTGTGYNTHYAQADFLSGDMRQVLGLMGEVILHPALREDEWPNVQRRIIAALDRRQDSWSGELFGHIRRAVYGDHPWAFEPTGRREAIERITIDDIRRFHRDRLGAEQAVLAVVGDVDPREVIETVKAVFGQMPRSAPITELAGLPEPRQPLARQVVTGKQNTAAGAVVLGPIPTRTDEDYAAMAVMGRVLSRFPSGRLTEALRGEGPGLAYAVWAFQQTGLRPGHFNMAFNSLPEKSPEALRQTVRVYRQLLDAPISQEELDHARAMVLTGEFLNSQSLSDQASELALDELYGLGRNSSEAFLEAVGRLTPEKLHEVARKYLVNPIVILMIDQPLDPEIFERAAAGDDEPLWVPASEEQPEVSAGAEGY
ncbi:MAG: insulinase family protein [Phycisphaeraceae bacterium]|nr:insulinase family protein [Phycisphaeraceae bacterium]